MRPKSPLARKAFTLIELLTVIAIIGILAGMIGVVVGTVQKKSKVAATKTMYRDWASGIEQYKTAYGTYPFLNNKYETNADTQISLENPTTVKEFIMCLSGRQPIFDGGGALSPGAGGDARKFNKKGTAFVTFAPEAFQMSEADNQYTRKLQDRFGNSNIRLVMDTDGNGIVKPTDTLPEGAADPNGNIAARVIFYTLQSDDPTQFEDILSWQ